MGADHAREDGHAAIGLLVGQVALAELVGPLGDEGHLGVDVAQAEHARVLVEEGPRLVARRRRDVAHEVTAIARLDVHEAYRAGRRRDADAGLTPRVLP